MKLTSSQALCWNGGIVETSDLLTVGAVAERSGFAPSALRYYERRRA